MFVPRAIILGWFSTLTLLGLSVANRRIWAADEEGQQKPQSEGIVIQLGEKTAAGGEEEQRLKARLGQLLNKVRESAAVGQGYWIGLTVEPADDAARVGRELQPGQGLIVESVIPESPAAKAGIEKGDILLAARDKPLANRDQLAEIIANVKEGELPLQVLRGKERKLITVKPAKHPGEGQVLVIREDDEDEKDEKHKLGEARQPRRMQVAPSRQPLNPPSAPFRPMPSQPGAALPAAAELPDDMQIIVKKSGHEPARVVVKQGEKAWRTTENELDMLPPAARAYAARLLGKPANPWIQQNAWNQQGGFRAAAPAVEMHRLRLQLDEKGRPQLTKEGAQPGAVQIEIREGAEQPARRIQWQELKRPQAPAEPNSKARQLHELREQLERLTRQLEELQKSEQRQ